MLNVAKPNQSIDPLPRSSAVTSSSASHVSIKVSAPGKVILHGEHSVVYNKLALAASLDLRTRLELEETKSGFSVELPALNLHHTYEFKELRELLDVPIPLQNSASTFNFTCPEVIDHDACLAAIFEFVYLKNGSNLSNTKQEHGLVTLLYLLWGILGTAEFDLKPFRLRLDTELSVSAGTGSSASYVVTLAAAFLHYVKIKGARVKDGYNKTLKFDLRTQIGKENVLEKTELELISKWGFCAEKVIHGTPSGVDNTICTFGSWVEFRKGTPPKMLPISAQFGAILVNTNVPRDTKQLVAKVVTLRERHRILVDGILSVMDNITAEAVTYLKTINDLVGDGLDAAENYRRLGELSEINHNLLRSLGVSHPKLDEACVILAENELQGKLTGAGGGGNAVCLVPPYISKRVVDEVVSRLNSKGFAAVFTHLGGKGVSID